jgi:hypothetical protein
MAPRNFEDPIRASKELIVTTRIIVEQDRIELDEADLILSRSRQLIEDSKKLLGRVQSG